MDVKSTMSGSALYTAIPLEDDQPENENLNFNSPFKYESAFDFSSIARFQKASFPPKSYFKFSKQNDKGLQAPVPAPAESCLTTVLSGLMLAALWSLTLLTLPVTGWWSLHRLQRWQRMVVFRLGKVQPVRGPGLTLLLPVLDKHQTVDLRNRAILVPPQQLITCDGAVAELGAEVRYRVCDAATFVGSCVEPETMLRSLSRNILVSTLSAQQLSDITRKGAEMEEAILLSINSQLKEWGMEASAVKLSETKVHKEAEHLPEVSPLLRQLGSMFGGGGGGGGGLSPLVAGQPPLSAAPLAAPPAADGDTAGCDEETAAALREAVARLPARPGLAAGVYRIRTTGPDADYRVIVSDDVREVEQTAPSDSSAADVTVTLTSADLRQLVRGQLSPAAAYAAGRLHVQGNVHLLMALGSLLRQADGGAPGGSAG